MHCNQEGEHCGGSNIPTPQNTVESQQKINKTQSVFKRTAHHKV